MTPRQRLLKLVYPLLMLFSRRKTPSVSHPHPAEPHSFYHLTCTRNDGTPFHFSTLKGRHVLLVNTASHCGYTAQYAELQQLQEQFHNKLVVLGFPSNDFGNQEPEGDAEIASFCERNFGVSFPLMQKAAVIGKAQQPVFEWLSNPELNGWNDRSPNWNFCKYHVGPEGLLHGFYPSGVNPLDEQITSKIALH